jgi:geranylgeranylglycerol-phosphate geranylgeranyltransferase
MLLTFIGYLRLMRIHNCLIAFFSIIMTSFIASRSLMIKPGVLLGAMVTLFIMGGGNALNDYFDDKIDRLNKPNRPIPSGLITRKKALFFSIALFFTGVVLSFSLNLLAMSIATANACLLIIYARYSKTMVFAANALIALMTSSVFIFSGAILNMIDLNMIVLASSAFFVMMSREILKDIEDIQGDRRSGALTLPIKLGVKRARAVSTVFVLPAILLIFLPSILKTMDSPYLGLIMLATMVLIFSLFLQPKKSQKVIKLATMIVLTAFLAGSF